MAEPDDPAESAWNAAVPIEQGARRKRSWDAPNPNYKPYKMQIIAPASWSGKEIPARRWLVDGLIPMRNVVMLSGDGGIGKSLLAMQLMVAASTGREFLGLRTERVKAFGLFCEDEADELQRRLAAVVEWHGLDFADLESVELVSRVGADNSLATFDRYTDQAEVSPFYLDLMNHIIASGAQIVVLDSLHDLFSGNENIRPHARQFIGFLRELAMEIDGAVILNAHPSLAGINTGTGAAGSTAWNNAVRSRLYLTRPKGDDDADDGDSDKRILSTKKSNYGPLGGEIPLTWHNGVFVRTDAPSGILGVIDRASVERTFLECLDAITAAGRHVTDYRAQPNYAPKTFARMRQGRGRSMRDFSIAMESLFAAGRIRMGEIRSGNRHSAMGIIRCPDVAP